MSPEPVFKGDSESKKGIFMSDLQLLLWLFQISNPKIGFDETGFKQDVLYIIWPQILRRFQNPKSEFQKCGCVNRYSHICAELQF